MHPEPTEGSRSESSGNLPLHQPQPLQHGLRAFDDVSSTASQRRAVLEDNQSSTTEAASADANATRRDSSDNDEATGLKGDVTPPGHRIIEYENSLSSTPAPREDSPPAFEVRKKHWKPTDTTSPVDSIPNGKSLRHPAINLASDFAWLVADCIVSFVQLY